MDLTNLKLGKILTTAKYGHSTEVAVSPDNKKIAYNKWADDRMDNKLWLLDLGTGKNILLTPGTINGEINRISWIDNQHILYNFASHASKRGYDGTELFIYDLGSNTSVSFNSSSNKERDNWYNTVRYIKDLNAILVARGSANAYDISRELYRNALYRVNTDGTDEQKLFDSGDGTIGRVIGITGTKKLAVEIYHISNTGGENADIYIYDSQTKKINILLDHNQLFAGKHLASEFTNICPYDSGHILFTESSKLFKVNINNKQVSEIGTIGSGKKDFSYLSVYN